MHRLIRMTTPKLVFCSYVNTFLSSFKTSFKRFLLFPKQIKGVSENNEKRRGCAPKRRTDRGPGKTGKPRSIKQAMQLSAPRQSRGQTGRQKGASCADYAKRYSQHQFFMCKILQIVSATIAELASFALGPSSLARGRRGWRPPRPTSRSRLSRPSAHPEVGIFNLSKNVVAFKRILLL